MAALGRRDAHLLHYRTDSDDVSLHDLAEGVERALEHHADLTAGRRFDVVVHSTGLLVLRAWLAARPERRHRLGRLVALAPASFGSPLAHVGRGVLGALFAGGRQPGPDFLEAGDRVLAALELGSPEVWRLADQPLPGGLIACGTAGYAGPLRLAHPSGSDGVVRFAGCGPDAPRTDVDLRRDVGDGLRVRSEEGTADPGPVVPVPGANHATILSAPPAWLVDLAARALDARDPSAAAALDRRVHRRVGLARARAARDGATLDGRQWLVRVEDDRGDPVPDYYIDLLVRPEGAHRWRPLREAHPGARLDVHVHRDDPSRRCFHLEPGGVDGPLGALAVRVLAVSGSDRVGYAGHAAPLDVESRAAGPLRWTGTIALDSVSTAPTTRLRIRVDREPLPLRGANRLVAFASPGVRSPA